jgi:hypothetical protein
MSRGPWGSGLGSARGLRERDEPEPEGLRARLGPSRLWRLGMPRAGWADSDPTRGPGAYTDGVRSRAKGKLNGTCSKWESSPRDTLSVTG